MTFEYCKDVYMPRPLRIEFENAWYHVMNRGANHQLIYKTNTHRNLFYRMLGEVVDQFQIEIHAFCLMSNHYHLLIKTPCANLSRAMRYLDGVYTQRFNRANKRDGALFRGRYKAILVDSDAYLLQVSRYIHLNPIEAKICDDPFNFKWSSYRCYVDKRFSIDWLNTANILNQMTGLESRQAYSQYVLQGIDEETRHFYNKKQVASIYGKKSFIRMHLSKLEASYISSVLTDVNRTRPLPTKETVLNNILSYFKISLLQLQESRQGKKNIIKLAAVYLLKKLAHISHAEISGIFTDVKSRSVSSLIDRAKKLISTDLVFKDHVDKITEKITTC